MDPDLMQLPLAVTTNKQYRRDSCRDQLVGQLVLVGVAEEDNLLFTTYQITFGLCWAVDMGISLITDPEVATYTLDNLAK